MPRPLTPTTATRSRSLGAAFLATASWARANRAWPAAAIAAAVANMESSRKRRRVKRDMGDLLRWADGSPGRRTPARGELR